MNWLIEKLGRIWDSPDPYDLALLPIVVALFITMFVPSLLFIEALALVGVMTLLLVFFAQHYDNSHSH